MKTIFLTVCGLATLFASCRQATSDDRTRIVYDAGNQQVITHSVNKKLETMSILYGNASAYQAALAGNGLHQPGERYTFVTWKYHDNPYWYGSSVNGELLSVEQLQVSTAGQIDYRVESGQVQPVNGRLLDREQRIAYLLDHRPSIMP